MGLSRDKIEAFVEKGYVRIEGAVAREVADEVRARLWRDLDPGSNAPAATLGGYAGAAMVGAIDSPTLRGAYDDLVGEGRWIPFERLSDVAVRFPVPAPEAAWHVDVNGPPEGHDPDDPWSWPVEIASPHSPCLCSCTCPTYPKRTGRRA